LAAKTFGGDLRTEIGLAMSKLSAEAFEGLWRSILWRPITVYFFGWTSKRQRQASPLKSTASVTILATVLAYVNPLFSQSSSSDDDERFIIFTADTWLHITTKTVNFIQITPVLDRAGYRLSLQPNCTTPLPISSVRLIHVP
jgi:hypothetical protein